MESIGDNFEIENQNGTTIKLYCPLDHLKTNRSAYNECSIKIEKCSSIFANETFLKSINAISHFSKNVEDMVYVRK